MVNMQPAASAHPRGIIRPIRLRWHTGACCDPPLGEPILVNLAAGRSARGRRLLRRAMGPGHNPLLAPLLVFGAGVVVAALYVAYILWPRWPDPPVAGNAPSLPIVVSGVAFNVEPAAIRVKVQRRPGVQERV